MKSNPELGRNLLERIIASEVEEVQREFSDHRAFPCQAGRNFLSLEELKKASENHPAVGTLF